MIRASGWCSHESGFCAGRDGPPVTLLKRPADYVDELARGTVEFSPEWRNYSFHRVRVQAGTLVHRCNFTQAQPGASVIEVVGAGGPVVFSECNLANVLPPPGAMLDDCLTIQTWLLVDSDEEGVCGRREFLCHTRDYVPPANPPANRLLVKPAPPMSESEATFLVDVAWHDARPELEARCGFECARLGAAFAEAAREQVARMCLSCACRECREAGEAACHRRPASPADVRAWFDELVRA